MVQPCPLHPHPIFLVAITRVGLTHSATPPTFHLSGGNHESGPNTLCGLAAAETVLGRRVARRLRRAGRRTRRGLGPDGGLRRLAAQEEPAVKTPPFAVQRHQPSRRRTLPLPCLSRGRHLVVRLPFAAKMLLFLAWFRCLSRGRRRFCRAAPPSSAAETVAVAVAVLQWDRLVEDALVRAPGAGPPLLGFGGQAAGRVVRPPAGARPTNAAPKR